MVNDTGAGGVFFRAHVCNCGGLSYRNHVAGGSMRALARGQPDPPFGLFMPHSPSFGSEDHVRKREAHFTP